MESSSSSSAAAAAAVASASMILAELRRQSQQLGERDALLFNTLEARQIQRDQERDENARQDSAALEQNVNSWLAQLMGNYQTTVMTKLSSIKEAQTAAMTELSSIKEAQTAAMTELSSIKVAQTTMMGELSSLKAAVKENTAKLSPLEQTMESVQTTVVSVEKICKETKTKIAAIRAIVGKNELTCNQTKESVNSFGNELSLFIEQQGDEEEESDNEDDGEDDIEGDDDTEDGEKSIVDKATSLKRKRESQWMAHYDRLLQCCKNHDEFPDRRILDDAYTDFKLGGWVQNQRYNYKNKRISDERVKLLNEVPGWKWIVGAGRKRAKN